MGNLKLRLVASLLSGAILLNSVMGNSAEGLGDRPPLDGVWVAESAEMSGDNQLGSAWNSILTIKDGTFSLTHFCDLSSTLRGTFSLDSTATPTAIDLNLPEIDMSERWEGVKYPQCKLLGFVKASQHAFTICICTGVNPQRPSEFIAKDRRMLLFSFVRADPGFEEFPKQVKVSVKDPDGNRVKDAIVFNFLSHWQDVQRNIGLKWRYNEIAKTDDEGIAQVAYDDLSISFLAARDATRKLTGIKSISPASLRSGKAELVLQPECQISGTLACERLTAMGKELGWTNVYLKFNGSRFAMCADPGKFQFNAPSGKYTLNAYGSNLWGKDVEITVPDHEAEYHVPPIELEAQNHILLAGQPAPELEGVVAWKGTPVKLADLKGKVILLDFWGYWCGPCVRAMPTLINLHERYQDKGLAIIAVHVDNDGTADTPEKLDAKLAVIKQKFWKGRDLPFSVALTSTDAKEFKPGKSGRTKAAEQYGISGYPTTILIDKAGNIVGQLEYAEEKEAADQIEKLLKPRE